MPQPFTRRLPGGLYAITPENLSAEPLITAAAEVLRGGARVLQYRAKSGSVDQRREDARRLVELCRQHQVCSIINDDPQLAAELDADGVHLGEHDGAIAAARALLGPSKLIGLSCYDDWQRAEAAIAAGADYLAFGAFFASRSKQTERRATPDLLSRAAAAGQLAVAIGGIRVDNAAPLIAAGAHGLAVIDALWNAPDQHAAARAFDRLFRHPA